MGKQGDLWDDSALLNAFDDAISKYKIMHGKKVGDVSNDKDVKSGSGDHPVADVDDHQEATRQEGADEKGDLPPNTITEVGENSNPSLVQENQSIDLHLPAEVAHGVQENYSYWQGAEDYNQLLNQLYELEQKRQQIFEQLHQYGSWNYQWSGDNSGSGTQWANGPTLQEHPLPVNQASNPTSFCCCCPYAGQCFAAPCTSVPTCFLGGSCAGKSVACETTEPGKSTPQEGSNIVETGIGAAERAISSMRAKFSGDSNFKEDKEKDKKEGAVVLSTGSGTDLAEVLNAWYSAGFYTGKYVIVKTCFKNDDTHNFFTWYLVEQSIAKKPQS